jgi:hypothetical protein
VGTNPNDLGEGITTDNSRPLKPERHRFRFNLLTLLVLLLVTVLITLFFWLSGKQAAGPASTVGIAILISWFCLGFLWAALPTLARRWHQDGRLRTARLAFELGLATLLLAMGMAWFNRAWLGRQVPLLLGIEYRHGNLRPCSGNQAWP